MVRDTHVLKSNLYSSKKATFSESFQISLLWVKSEVKKKSLTLLRQSFCCALAAPGAW